MKQINCKLGLLAQQMNCLNNFLILFTLAHDWAFKNVINQLLESFDNKTCANVAYGVIKLPKIGIFVVVIVVIWCSMCKCFDILFGGGFVRSYVRRCRTRYYFKTFCNLIFKLPFDVWCVSNSHIFNILKT